MANGKEAVNKLMDIVDKLQGLRGLNVSLENQIALHEQKKVLHTLNLKRIEAKHVLEVEKARQGNGQPLAHDIHVKRAMVEDLLAQDMSANETMHKLILIDKHIQRKSRQWGVNDVQIKALESQEKILILQAT